MGSIGENYRINIIDATGRLLMDIQDAAVDGNNQLEINVAEHSTGIYFLMINSNDVVEKVRLVIE